MMLTFLAAASTTLVLLHGRVQNGVDIDNFPVNQDLGVSGFPDCVRRNPGLALNMEEAGMDLVCAAKQSAPSAVKIATIGDSITAGVHSSGGNHTYPAQLQIMLDSKYGWGKYSVTNLGACGSTMMKGADSPYWKRPQYAALLAGKPWDIVTIMLGTNDAKDSGDGGPNNWHHNCGGPSNPTLEGCTYATDFMAMIDEVRTLGRSPSTPPEVYVAMPPPLMAPRAYGMNQTVINSVLPKLAALIIKAKDTLGPLNLYSGMGGVEDWKTEFPSNGCTLTSSWAPCAWWCDAQSCDECHPNDNGYHQLATSFLKQMTSLPPPPPTPPSPAPSPPGVWIYEQGGIGKLLLTAANFSANKNSGRKGALAWDACPGGTFDNGNPIWPKSGNKIGGVRAGGKWALVAADPCGKTFNYPNMTVSSRFDASAGILYISPTYLEVAQQ